ncbi:MAG: MaoC family dehydratase N-terminal domain-containing protein [Gammaproteobacteria bacterium]
MTEGFSLDKEFAEAQKWKLTDEDIERAKVLIGLYIADNKDQFVTEASANQIRNYAFGTGDDNPLYCDPAYGRRTRWGTQIAPPSMAEVVQRAMRGDPLSKEIRAQTKGLFRGVHEYFSGSEKFYYQPIYPGDALYCYTGDDDMVVKPSEYAGRSLTRFNTRMKINQHGAPVFKQTNRRIYAERSSAVKKGKYMKIEPTVYTDEMLEKIDAIYARETARGAEPRWWEDVAAGEAMPAMVKGPLLTTHVFTYHAGGYGIMDFGLFGSRLWHKNRKRIPPFYIKNEQGIPDVAQRVHWDSKWANAIGNPMAYDYSVIREAWLNHYLTDWVGDDGWVWRQYDEMRKFNYVGDTQFLSGSVTGKRVEDGRYYVDLQLEMKNQRDEVTTRGEATVLLPSRDGGPVILPPPPFDVARTAARMFVRHNQLAGA